MRRFLPLLIGITVTLLAGCESKREICARYAAGDKPSQALLSSLRELRRTISP